MDQKKFKKKMNNEEILPITNDELQATINESFSTFGKQEMPKGAYNVVIAMEECAECIQQSSKFVRGQMDRDHLLEEVADVFIAMEYVKKAANFTEDEIKKAMRIKLNEINKKMKGMDTKKKSKKKKKKKG